MRPPYPGQGKAIPSYLGSGFWIIENVIFLWLGSITPDDKARRSKFDLMGVVQLANGNMAVGVHAPTLAEKMNLSLKDVEEANRGGMLNVSNRIVAPRPGDADAMRFTFRFEDKFCEMDVGRSSTKLGQA
jgi:hypothetical protein